MCAARSFLNEQGEGVYSVVVRTEAIGAATESMRSRGAELTYHQSRDGDGYTLQEAQFDTGVRDADHSARDRPRGVVAISQARLDTAPRLGFSRWAARVSIPAPWDFSDNLDI